MSRVIDSIEGSVASRALWHWHQAGERDEERRGDARRAIGAIRAGNGLNNAHEPKMSPLEGDYSLRGSGLEGTAVQGAARQAPPTDDPARFHVSCSFPLAPHRISVLGQGGEARAGPPRCFPALELSCACSARPPTMEAVLISRNPGGESTTTALLTSSSQVSLRVSLPPCRGCLTWLLTKFSLAPRQATASETAKPSTLCEPTPALPHSPH